MAQPETSKLRTYLVLRSTQEVMCISTKQYKCRRCLELRKYT